MTRRVRTLRERMADVEVHLEAQHKLLAQLSQTVVDMLETALERDKKTHEVINKLAAVVDGIQRRELERATAHWAPPRENPRA